MADEQVQKLLQGALKAAREGNADQARKAFLYVLKMQPQNEVAWMGLATVAQDQREQIIALQKAVDINPQNTRAQAALQRIQGAGQPPAPERTSPPSSPVSPAEALDSRFDDDTRADDASDMPTDDETVEDTERETVAEDPLQVVPPTMPAPPVSAPAPTSPILPETPLFSHLPLTPSGEDGVPVPKRRVLETVTQQGETLIEVFLHQEMEDRLIEWQRKPRNRAGEREIVLYRLRILGAVATFLLVVGGIGAALVLNSPEFRKVVFAPTWTVSPTLTFTPSNTPGATLTASPTPLESSTPTPTLDASVTPGRPEVVYRPEPTRVYFPPGVQRSRAIEEADALINARQFEDAVETLEEERQATDLTGDFMPYYYLAQIAIERGDYEAAQDLVTQGRVRWEDRTNETFFEPMIRVSEARLQYLRLQQQLAEGSTLNALQRPIDDLKTSLQQALELGGDYDEPYLLLADVYRMTGEYADALEVLTTSQTGRYRRTLFGNLRLRLKKAEVLRDMGQLNEALFELDDLLRLNPFEESALRMRMDIAMQKGDPGLVVLYAEAYQYYYPENIVGYRMMGDAFIQEGKIGQAMEQYTRALQGRETDVDYPGLLASRAAVFASQGRDAQALADFTRAVEIAPQNMDFRWQRYQLAYRAGDYALAAEDLTALQEARAITSTQFTILSTQIQMEQAALDANGQQQALTALRRLRPADIPNDLRPLVEEMVARLEFGLGDEASALTAVENALAQENTASRHVLRGQILQAQAEAATRDETRLTLYQAAQREYDFVLSWSVVYRYPFLDEVMTRYETVSDEIVRLRTALAEEES